MTKVAVTGVGGGIGQSILKCLQGSDYSAVAMDAGALSAGLYAAPRAVRIPLATAPDFVSRVIEICRCENIRAIVPGLDPELPVFAAHVEAFRDAGIILLVSPPEVVRIADDKQATIEFLARAGLPVLASFPLAAEVGERLRFPILLKPRRGGSRSAGVYLAQDATDLAGFLATLDTENYVAQEYIDGDEFTCGSLTFDGRCYGTIAMRRTLRSGDTQRAFVVRDERISRVVSAAAEALRPFGPCNFQLRLRDGLPYIFEINARCSGTTAARAMAGFNEPKSALDFLLHCREPHFEVREIAVLRYWRELVIDPARIRAMETHGAIDGEGATL